ncbi:MAG: hypothetical protein IPM29_00460 [Planctomycetes bacterium]|nr:hypothetical protein [Planctomycetota bacterium]
MQLGGQAQRERVVAGVECRERRQREPVARHLAPGEPLRPDRRVEREQRAAGERAAALRRPAAAERSADRADRGPDLGGRRQPECELAVVEQAGRQQRVRPRARHQLAGESRGAVAADQLGIDGRARVVERRLASTERGGRRVGDAPGTVRRQQHGRRAGVAEARADQRVARAAVEAERTADRTELMAGVGIEDAALVAVEHQQAQPVRIEVGERRRGAGLERLPQRAGREVEHQRVARPIVALRPADAGEAAAGCVDRARRRQVEAGRRQPRDARAATIPHAELLSCPLARCGLRPDDVPAVDREPERGGRPAVDERVVQPRARVVQQCAGAVDAQQQVAGGRRQQVHAGRHRARQLAGPRGARVDPEPRARRRCREHRAAVGGERERRCGLPVAERHLDVAPRRDVPQHDRFAALAGGRTACVGDPCAVRRRGGIAAA